MITFLSTASVAWPADRERADGCDYLLIPTMAETFAASGITQLYDTYKSVKKYTNPALRIDGVLLTRTERTRVTKTIQELTEKIADYMGADVTARPFAAT